MPLYYPVISKIDYIGGVTSQVQILEPDASIIGYNEFVKQSSVYNLILDSIDIISFDKNLLQISQPFTINYKEMDGTNNSIIHVPAISGRAYNSTIKNISFKKQLLIDGISGIEYTILANSTITLLLTAKKNNEKRIKTKAFSENDLYHDEISFKAILSKGAEPEEIKAKSIAAKPIAEIKEPSEEIKPIEKVKIKKEIKPILLIEAIEETDQIYEHWLEEADNTIQDLENTIIEEQKILGAWENDAKEVTKKVKLPKTPKIAAKKEKDLIIATRWNFKHLIWEKSLQIKK